ncbi:MAG: ribosome biogenesis GTP-binding protein YihA/YsxC [Deltaproteobacteria bacterium]|jgi:GTP-binding protein|nr:ribosome biogenesis GTP-binding protein YihA/YsxC [Deltaproteobacteria bacterium]
MQTYNITNATFITSVFEIAKLPQTQLSEVALVGRSNVGKSSLLNAIVGRNKLAKTSNTPGKTQSFNYFKIEFKSVLDQLENCNQNLVKAEGHIVDLPGYGYAKVNAQMQKKWAEQIVHYLRERQQLKGICLFLDCRRQPEREEILISQMCQDGSFHNSNFLLLLTKIDKLSNRELANAKNNLKKSLLLEDSQILPVSTVGNKKFYGVESARKLLCSWLASSR